MVAGISVADEAELLDFCRGELLVDVGDHHPKLALQDGLQRVFRLGLDRSDRCEGLPLDRVSDGVRIQAIGDWLAVAGRSGTTCGADQLRVDCWGGIDPLGACGRAKRFFGS